jgi:hypothetical protein
MGTACPTLCNTEIGSVSLAIHGYVTEGSAVLALGRKPPGDAFDRAEVGIAEGIRALQRRIPWIVRLPGAEVSSGMNHPHRLGISQIRFEAQRFAGDGVTHLQILNIKNYGKLALFGSVDHQLHVVADEIFYIDLCFAPAGPNSFHLLTVILWWNVQRHTSYIDGIDVSRSVEQIPDSGAETEFRDTDQRRHSRLMAIRIVLAVNSQAFARDLKSSISMASHE